MQMWWICVLLNCLLLCCRGSAQPCLNTWSYVPMLMWPSYRSVHLSIWTKPILLIHLNSAFDLWIKNVITLSINCDSNKCFYCWNHHKYMYVTVLIIHQRYIDTFKIEALCFWSPLKDQSTVVLQAPVDGVFKSSRASSQVSAQGVSPNVTLRTYSPLLCCEKAASVLSSMLSFSLRWQFVLFVLAVSRDGSAVCCVSLGCVTTDCNGWTLQGGKTTAAWIYLYLFFCSQRLERKQ